MLIFLKKHSMPFKLNAFRSICRFMFVDLPRIILILTLCYNKATWLRAPCLCIVLSYSVSVHMRFPTPPPPTVITDWHWTYNVRLRVCIIFLNEWPYSSLWVSQQEIYITQLFAVYSLYHNALRLVSKTYVMNVETYLSLSIYVCYHYVL